MNNAVVRDDVRIQDLNASDIIGKPSGRIGTNERVGVFPRVGHAPCGRILLKAEDIAADRLYDDTSILKVGGQHNPVDDVRLEDALDQHRIQFGQTDVQRRQKVCEGVVIRRQHG